MLKNIDLTNKCGSCCHFKPIEDTANGECLQNPYNDSVVHDPKHPHWIVQRSRIKCRLYDAKPQTNADRIRVMSDGELKTEIHAISLGFKPWCDYHCENQGDDGCDNCIGKWLQQPAEP